MATLVSPPRSSSRLYVPPEGTYDQPFFWIFDGSTLTDGSNALNQFVYIKAGFGDFICRRIVGLSTVLHPATGQYQIYDRYLRPIESAPTNVTAIGTDDQMLPCELDYPETSAIRFDLYNVLRDPPGYNFPAFTLASQLPSATTGGGIALSTVGGPGGTLGGDTIQNFLLISTPNAFSGSPSQGGYVSAAAQVAGEPGWSQYAEIIPDPTFLLDNAGNPVSLSGLIAVYGAPSSPPSGGDTDLGAAFIAQRNNLGAWTQVQQLEGSDSVAGDTFGSSVGIDQSTDGTTIAVGAINATSAKGAVYVFTESGGVWTQSQKLQPSDLSDGDEFGAPVWVYGEFMFIAAQQQGSAAGAVYIYRFGGGTWTQIQKLTGTTGDLFGFSIAFDGQTLAIGEIGTNQVFLYTYNGSTFTLQQTITGSDSTTGDSFGSAVSVATTYGLLAVGAYKASGGTGAGKAYLFKFISGSWTQEQEFTQPDATSGENFYGLAVSINAYLQASGNVQAWLAVGAPGWNGNGSSFGQGQVYLYGSVAPDPVTKIIEAQIAFHGVARKPGPPPLIASQCAFDPRTFSYVLETVIDVAGPSVTPTVSLYQTIDDYDFELDTIIITYSSGSPTLPAIITQVQLYDAVKNVVSNIPMLDIYLNGAPGSLYEDGALVPPLVYPSQTQIRLDVYSMVQSAYLPITMTVEFRGRQRYPCVTC